MATTAAASARKPFLTREQAVEVRRRFGTPCYVYDRAQLEDAAKKARFDAPDGLTLRYAMKANPSGGILEVFRELKLHLDASSDFEVERALHAGFAPETIQLTSQMPSKRLKEWVRRGVLFNACSLHQLDMFGRETPGGSLAVRINAGAGSGFIKRTNTGGPGASFGIWKDYLGRVQSIAKKYRLNIRTLHSHIGSGTNPKKWERATRRTLDIAKKLPSVKVVNLGGGFSVGRMPEETTVDMEDVGRHISAELEAFKARTGRALHLEIEPGTYLVALAGAIVATCIDVVDTGRRGHIFAKLDTGMTEITRPSLYGAQHPIDVMVTGRRPAQIVFVGPCCESGDILTPKNKRPNILDSRLVPKPKINDLVLVGGAGAYCGSMSTINYNSYPQAPEVMLERDGTLREIRKRQEAATVWANEV